MKDLKYEMILFFFRFHTLILVTSRAILTRLTSSFVSSQIALLFGVNIFSPEMKGLNLKSISNSSVLSVKRPFTSLRYKWYETFGLSLWSEMNSCPSDSFLRLSNRDISTRSCGSKMSTTNLSPHNATENCKFRQ